MNYEMNYTIHRCFEEKRTTLLDRRLKTGCAQCDAIFSIFIGQ